MSKTVSIPKTLVSFCLRHIIKSVAYSKGFGVYNEVLGFHIPEEAYFEIQKMIDNDEFPDGYYKLCDILGEEYCYE